jgi:capsular exopolysaccharide synthesis family protein
MSSREQSGLGFGSSFGDQAVNSRRYLDALRRGAWLIGVIVVVVTGVVAVVSLIAHKTYSASASIVYNPSSAVLQPTDAPSIERQLATFEALVRTPAVTALAAHEISQPQAALRSAISASADPKANIITINASAPRPILAAKRANAVARAFLSVQQAQQTAGYNQARAQLQTEIAELRGNPAAASQIAALQDRINALQINAAGTNSELQISEPATPPASAASPRPTLNTIIALFASLLIGVLVVLARDQVRPRFSSPREVANILNQPVLVSLPYRARAPSTRRRMAQAALEHETFDALQASVRLLGSNAADPHVLLITSAVHGEGKTTVTANLGRSLARAGQRTLVVSADLRFPSLHEHFQLPLSPGLSDLLTAVQRRSALPPKQLEQMIRPVPSEPGLQLLAAGEVPPDPSSLLSGSALGFLFEWLRESDYNHILVDSPPLLGLGDTSFLAQEAREVLVVARLDRVSPEQVQDLDELIGRLRLNPLGLVVVGTKLELNPYYLSERKLTLAD